MTRYAYSHPDGKGVGEHHAAAHDRELPAEMRDLDLAHGTEAEHVATDQDTGALILSWRDRTGVLRHSAVSPDYFSAHFTPLDADPPPEPEPQVPAVLPEPREERSAYEIATGTKPEGR